MANRDSENREVRKLGKQSPTSIGLTLPIELVRKLGWRVKQKVTVKRRGNKLIVEDWKE